MLFVGNAESSQSGLSDAVIAGVVVAIVVVAAIIVVVVVFIIMSSPPVSKDEIINFSVLDNYW